MKRSSGGDPGRPVTLLVVAVGGVAGACARYGIELAWPLASGGVPWATFLANVSGSLLLGVLMVCVREVEGVHPLLRPAVGAGLIGGFTTFSTYAVQSRDLLAEEAEWLGAAYLLGTLATALAAVVVGMLLARSALRRVSR